MSKKGARSIQETRMLLEETIYGIRTLSRFTEHKKAVRGDIDVLTPSFVHKLTSMCELVLELVCLEHATPEGTIQIPSLKDLGNLKKDVGLVFPIMTRVSAGGINHIKKETDKNSFVGMD